MTNRGLSRAARARSSLDTFVVMGELLAALSRVGLTEREAVDRGLPVKVVEKAVADIAGMPRRRSSATPVA
ncbi:hypothetical protein [Amycolatopsis sp. NPDC051061]|uniref:hypothetical protein n=1 Tax=Amycolatopsis sp. NPDC051061 TaxID=3155042 RepID=UPI00343AC6EB